MKKLWPFLAVVIFFISAVWVDFNHSKWKKDEVLNYDIMGYHNYLPALFIYKDITAYNYLDSIEAKYKPTHGEHRKYGMHPAPKTGNLCNQYPLGVAIFQAPFFGVAHLWASVTGQDVADGYSSPYQHAIVLSTLLFATLGLIILTAFLRFYFSGTIVFFCISLLAFATNFFHYATLESGMAHIYQFFLYASVLYLTHRWYERPAYRTSVLMGLCIGLAIVTRPVDILICLIPLTWAMGREGWIDFLKQHQKHIYVVMLSALVACLPQIIYWKYVTGDWVFYSYGSGDFFQFKRFRVIHGLFSYRKGWFIYTPLALLAFIYAWNISKNARFSFYGKPFWIFFIPMIYIVFSWNNWYYGWSYGCRALLGTLPLLAIPLGLMLKNLAQSKPVRKVAMTATLIFITFLNLFQTWQYEHYILHGTLMNESTYWALFLKTETPPDFDKNYKIQSELDWNTGGW